MSRRAFQNNIKQPSVQQPLSLFLGPSPSPTNTRRPMWHSILRGKPNRLGNNSPWGPDHKWINWGVQLQDLEAHWWPIHLQNTKFWTVCKQARHKYSTVVMMMFIRKTTTRNCNVYVYRQKISKWVYCINGSCHGLLFKLNTSMLRLPQVPRSQHQVCLLPQRSPEAPPTAKCVASRACRCEGLA